MLWQVPDLENIADDDTQARAVKTEEEALLDFHVTLIHKWRTEEGETGSSGKPWGGSDKILPHIFPDFIPEKKGKRNTLFNLKLRSRAQHHQFILKVNEFSLQKKLLCLFYTWKVSLFSRLYYMVCWTRDAKLKAMTVIKGEKLRLYTIYILHRYLAFL